MNVENIGQFCLLLERNGYDGAFRLVHEDLIPIARRHGLSLLEAAKRYANCDEDQDTSFFQLGETLRRINEADFRRLGADKKFQ